LFAARSALVRVQTEQRVQRVNLHLALGGGFGGPGSGLRDRTVSRVDGGTTIVDVYRVVGAGGAEIRAPAAGWPPALKLRLHGFQPLSALQADAIATDPALDRRMTCQLSRSVFSDDGYRCTLQGKAAGESRAADDYLEIDIPPAMLAADTLRVDVRWSEATTLAAR
jgi:hypothetical protein